MTRLKLALLALLLAALLPGLAGGQEGPLPPDPEPERGSLSGRVEDPGGSGVGGARVKLEGGLGEWTDRSGRFRFEGLPPGRYGITVSKSGYRTAQGSVTIVGGDTRSLLVTLTPEGGGPAPTPSPVVRTTLTVAAYHYRTSDRNYWVKQIEVWDTEKRWTNTFYRTYSSNVELRCDGAVVGRRYKVAITWRSRDGYELRGMWEPQVWKQDQKETYYNP